MVSNSNQETAISPTVADRPIRVMVVDDSVVIRGLISRWLSALPDIEVVAKHANGKLAVDNLLNVDPDVVLLDIEMPEMDGITALERMIEIKPGLTVIMASTLTRRNAEISLKAMQIGASDYIPKPESTSEASATQSFSVEIVERVRALGRSALRRRERLDRNAPQRRGPAPTQISGGGPGGDSDQLEAEIALKPLSNVTPEVVAIASSTGGPQALLQVLRTIASPACSRPIFITQHMPSNFTKILAQHLSRSTGGVVKEAEHGELVQHSCVYLAPGSRHLVLREKDGGVMLELSDAPPVNFCRPAADPMIASIVEIWGKKTLGVILTGMGHDGRDGAIAIAKAGGNVIAQDEQSSVVWGMPGAAAKAGACAAVLPLSDIGGKIDQLLGEGRP